MLLWFRMMTITTIWLFSPSLQLLYMINAEVVHMLSCQPASALRSGSYIWWSISAELVMLFIVDCSALAKVLMWLHTVLSPINAFSSYFMSQTLNNCFCVSGSGLTKLSLENNKEIQLQPVIMVFRTKVLAVRTSQEFFKKSQDFWKQLGHIDKNDMAPCTPLSNGSLLLRSYISTERNTFNNTS